MGTEATPAPLSAITLAEADVDTMRDVYMQPSQQVAYERILAVARAGADLARRVEQLGMPEPAAKPEPAKPFVEFRMLDRLMPDTAGPGRVTASLEGCDSLGGFGMTDPLRQIMADLRRPPRAGTLAADLTDIEKLALCRAAGVPIETWRENLCDRLVLRTKVPVSISDSGDGGYIVAAAAGRVG